MSTGSTVTDHDGGRVDCVVCGTPMFYESNGYNHRPTREEIRQREDMCSNCRYDRRAFGGPEGAARAEAWFPGGGIAMYTTPYCAITITRPFGQAGKPEVHVHGDMWPVEIDLALDEVRRQIGTYDETPLDRFTAKHGLEVNMSTNRDGSYHALMEASLREPGTTWGLLISSADGETPAAARRNLAARISGGTLVRGAMFPSPEYIQVPDLAGQAAQTEVEPAGNAA